MYKFIQRNRKKMLAIFVVGLMIVFLTEGALNRNNTPRNIVVAHVTGDDGSGDDGEITLSDKREAAAEWNQIANSGVLLRALPFAAEQVFAATKDDQRPDLFLLLQREARQLGLRVTDQQATEALQALVKRMTDAGVRPPNLSGAKPLMAKLMLISALFERVMTASGKFSDASLVHEMTTSRQLIKLNVVSVDADEFKPKKALAPAGPLPAAATTAPTTLPSDVSKEELDKQFKQYSVFAAGTQTESNPFGFGYLVPAEVKLLYVTVPRAEVARVVRENRVKGDKAGSEFQWNVDAMIAYRNNPSRFAATSQPTSATTLSATGPTTGPTTTVAATGPTTKPFEEVREQIIAELMRKEVDGKVGAIAATLRDRMTTDFQAPAAKRPADFGTRAYLDRLAAEVGKQSGGVKLGISEINDPKSEKELDELEGIGRSFAGETTFAQYIMRWADPFVPKASKEESKVLSLAEPSPAFRDDDGNVYVVQVQEATPAHAPAGLDAVMEQVADDVRTRLAFEAAVAAARELRESIAAGERLADAAKRAKRDVYTTPEFVSRQGDNPTRGEQVKLLPAGTELTPATRERLLARAFELLAQASESSRHPTTLIELPAAGTVLVAELADVARPWQDEAELASRARMLGFGRMQQFAAPILVNYFSLDAVKRRLGYRSTRDDPDAPAPTPAPATPPPAS